MSKVKATYDGFVGHEGVPVLLHDGDEYDSGHPLVAARPELFTSPPPVPVKPEVVKPTPAKPVPTKPAPAKPTAGRGKAKGANG